MFVGKDWCLFFKYKIDGDDIGTLNVFVVKNGQFDDLSKKFSKSEDRVSFYTPVRIDIDGRQYTETDMVEVSRQLANHLSL